MTAQPNAAVLKDLLNQLQNKDMKAFFGLMVFIKFFVDKDVMQVDLILDDDYIANYFKEIRSANSGRTQ